MSQSLVPAPRNIPPLRAGEIDGRYMDCTPDLGPTGDVFPSISVLSISIVRVDDVPMGPDDLQPAGTAWPNTLDATGLIPTFGFLAPEGNPGVSYVVTLTANTTMQGRLFIRDWILDIVPFLG